LFYLLAEPNDAILIPAPFYAAFENDMKVVARCVPIPVYMENHDQGPSKEDLETAARKAEEKGLTVKILLLTNPNNPLGVIYSPNVIRNSIAWARQTRRMHTIVDEIYALSVFDNSRDEFQSVTRILNNKLSHDVHFLWALSKDFGSSGFRIGVLYTQNAQLLEALANLNIFSAVSHPMQLVTAKLLSNDEEDATFCDSFIQYSAAELQKSYALCTSKLEEIDIPYVKAKACMFVYCDFSSVIPTTDFEGEKRFATLLQDRARVVMTPGESQRDDKPGRFRICYAWVSREVLNIGMNRIQRLVNIIRERGWDDSLEKDVSLLEEVIG